MIKFKFESIYQHVGPLFDGKVAWWYSLHGNILLSVHIFSMFDLKLLKEWTILVYQPWTSCVNVIFVLYTFFFFQVSIRCAEWIFNFSLVFWWRYILLLRGPLFFIVLLCYCGLTHCRHDVNVIFLSLLGKKAC